MKTKAILAIILIFIICTSCKKTTECKTSHWPEPGVTISWDGCNDVMTTKAYFDCHDSAIIINRNKTIEVCGYIKSCYIPAWGCNSMAICSDTNYTPENSILIDCLDGFPMPAYNTTCMSKLTGQIGLPYWNDDCCNYKLHLFICNIEQL